MRHFHRELRIHFTKAISTKMSGMSQSATRQRERFMYSKGDGEAIIKALKDRRHFESYRMTEYQLSKSESRLMFVTC